jgi:LCP family protein required for cell wall assembly
MPDSPEPPPAYTRYRARPRLLDRGGDALARFRRGEDGRRPAVEPHKRRKPFTWKRALKWVVLAIVGWLALSLVLFLISAQIQKSNVDDAAKNALAGGGAPPFSATTVLFLGSDQRPKGTHEAGASTSGPSRSDSILLMRVGGGHNARLSIPRDTVVDIPGHGRAKINAAYAYGGAALAIQTVERLLGIDVDHLVLVSFTNFPKLIDAMGGIDYKGACVKAKVNGGYKNGGVTLHIPGGKQVHLDGKQALALSRVRENSCRPNENELTRERRQQRILSAMKGRMTSPTTFFRLPWVSWTAPKAMQTDMGGPSLLGLFTALGTAGSPKTRVLRGTPQAGTPLGDVQTVTPEQAHAAAQKFLSS